MGWEVARRARARECLLDIECTKQQLGQRKTDGSAFEEPDAAAVLCSPVAACPSDDLQHHTARVAQPSQGHQVAAGTEGKGRAEGAWSALTCSTAQTKPTNAAGPAPVRRAPWSACVLPMFPAPCHNTTQQQQQQQPSSWQPPQGMAGNSISTQGSQPTAQGRPAPRRRAAHAGPT